MSAEEVALSVEETNKLRASLGLKPLSLEPAMPAAQPRQQQQDNAAAKAQKAAADTAELRAKLEQARDKRRQEELLATKTLGEADPEVDDVAAWVARSRKTAAERAAEEQRRAASAAAAPAASRHRDDDDHDDDAAPSAAELAGAKVRTDVSGLGEGETAILTLADRGVLDEDGGDELEDVLLEQEKARRKARRAATKVAKPLWEEDGKVRGLLDKYDEEDDEAEAAAFDEHGRLAAVARRQEDTRRKLAEGAAALLGGGSDGDGKGGEGDFMTEAEAAATFAPKGGKKKVKKSRKLRAKPAAELDDDVDTGGGRNGGGEDGGLDLDALEAEARAAGAADLGSRHAREARRDAEQASRAAAAADRAARFEKALEKANWASQALRQQPGGKAGGGTADAAPVGDDVDDELQASLARCARRLAHSTAAASATNGGVGGGGGSAAAAPASVQAMAAQLAKKREEDEAREREALLVAPSSGAEVFTETTEFVRAIAAPGELLAADERGEAYMDVDVELAAAANGGGDAAAATATAAGAAADGGGDGEPSAKRRKAYRQQQQPAAQAEGGWVSAAAAEAEQADEARSAATRKSAAGGGGGVKAGASGAAAGSGADADAALVVTRERAIGRGLGAALALLQDKGELGRSDLEWSGRTNDKRRGALQGLDDVYTGGSAEGRMAQSIEAALTQRDEFGRVMTPKDRFRQLNYEFHGIAPSKNKMAKRQQQYMEDLAVKHATTSEDPSVALDKLRAVQARLGTAYVPLDKQSAQALPGARDDDGDDALGAAAPARGSKGGKGGGGMPPPAPRRPKQ